MKRLQEITLGLSTIFGNHIDNDIPTRIISFCNAESKRELHCVSQKLNQLCSYNNLANILDHNPDTLTQKEKEYALLWATQRNHYHIVKKLFECGTNPNADNRLHLSPLTVAQNKNNGKATQIDKDNVPIIKLLKQYECTINKEYTQPPSFIIAMYTRDIPMLEQCIDRGVYDPDYSYDIGHNCGNTRCCLLFNILHLAAYIGDTNILTILLSQPKIAAKINAQNRENLTPYWIAEKRNYIPFLEVLAAHPDMDINTADNHGNFSINEAAVNGHTHLVKLLTSHKDYKPDIIDVSKSTPLYNAAQENHIETAKIFLDDPRINVNYLCDNKYTSLYIASLEGRTRMIKLLLTHPTIKEDLTGEATPLYAACQKGYLDCVKILCLANPNMINTPFKNTSLPILKAIEKNHLEIVKHLLSYENIALTHENGDTIFGFCCVFNYPEAAALFLQCRPEVLNICDENTGDSPLHLAAKEGHNAVVKILLQTNKCDVNILNKDNKTPLDVAENNDTQELILAHGGKYGKDVQEQQIMII
jgi:ankyrin repeat protein